MKQSVIYTAHKVEGPTPVLHEETKPQLHCCVSRPAHRVFFYEQGNHVSPNYLLGEETSGFLGAIFKFHHSWSLILHNFDNICFSI